MANLLVETSPGELIDKITILQIKSERITDDQKLAHIRHELAVLTKALETSIDMTEHLNSLKTELKTVNEALWDIEDDIRVCEKNKDFSDTFIQLARAVYVTNDKRAALKKDINLALNSALVEEKSYADYN